MAANSRVGDWQCPNNQCINHQQYPQSFVYGSKVNCPKCGTGKSATRPGDWCCPNPGCVNHQNTVYGSKPNCSRCGAERPALNARGMAMPNASPNIVGPPDAGARPGGVPAPRVGDWHCPNPTCKNYKDNLVFASKDFCPICGTEKPAPPPGAPGQPGPPVMHHHAPPPPRGGPPDLRSWGGGKGGGGGGFGGGGFGGASCGGCGGLGPGGVSQPRPGDWHCSNATCKNHRDNVVYSSKSSCPICGTPKPQGGGLNAPIMPAPRVMPPPPSAPMMGMFGGMSHGGPPNGGPGGKGKGRGQPGDWHCSNPTCKNHTDNVVYASKMVCPICSTPKPSTGILVSSTCRPGDWQCPNNSCKNHVNGVYASKAICNLCGMPNPGAEGRPRSRSPRSFFAEEMEA